MGAQKFYEIEIQPDVRLAALSTTAPEEQLSHVQFLFGRVRDAKGIRCADDLTHYLEWATALDAFLERMAKKAGVTEPQVQQGPEAPLMPQKSSKETGPEYAERCDGIVRKYQEAHKALVDEYNAARREYDKAVYDASVSERLYVSEGAFLAGIKAAKEAIDEACEWKGPQGPALAVPWQPKFLRLFHATKQSRVVEAKDVPVGMLPPGAQA
jgi:hypothetical protein